jgi:hypothetical protein
MVRVQAAWGSCSVNTRRKTFVKRLLYLVIAALVAMLILVPTAMAQTDTTTSIMQEQTKMREKDLPKSGGMPVGSILLPAAVLLVGGGIIGYAVLRRR